MPGSGSQPWTEVHGYHRFSLRETPVRARLTTGVALDYDAAMKSFLAAVCLLAAAWLSVSFAAGPAKIESKEITELRAAGGRRLQIAGTGATALQPERCGSSLHGRRRAARSGFGYVMRHTSFGVKSED